MLDETTSSLDSKSEQRVQATLDWFKKQRKTIIIIAHRLSTTMKCDNILVLKNGHIVEQGSHQTLIDYDSDYAKLWKFNSGISI